MQMYMDLYFHQMIIKHLKENSIRLAQQFSLVRVWLVIYSFLLFFIFTVILHIIFMIRLSARLSFLIGNIATVSSFDQT